jgi:hypothetical protein
MIMDYPSNDCLTLFSTSKLLFLELFDLSVNPLLIVGFIAAVSLSLRVIMLLELLDPGVFP